MSQDQKQSPNQSPTFGFAMSLALLAVAGVLYFLPTYLGSPLITRLTSLVFICVGILGLGSEFENLAKARKTRLGGMSLAIGLVCIIIWALIYQFFPNPWISAVNLIFLIFAALGIFDGVLEFLYSAFTATPSVGGIPLKIFLGLAQIIAFLAGLLQIFQILKIVK